MRGFDITPEAKRTIDFYIKNYYTYKEEVENGIDDEDYYTFTGISYDRVMTSRTNAITDTTQLGAIRVSEKRMELDLKKSRIDAIDKGIARAAKTTTRIDLVQELKNDLFENMVDKKPRHDFPRATKTFQKYRRRAYYYIAEEMGLLR